jgi:hypothetical protein
MICPRCHQAFSRHAAVPVFCRCGYVIRDGEQPADCPHLGPVTETITRDLLACGCQTIRLHRCGHFAELVTIQPIRRPNAVDTAESLRAAVAEFFPDYAGRTCRGCEIPARPDATA